MSRMPIKVKAENPDGSFSTVEMYPDAKCNICGSDHVAAMWCGCEDVFICLTCAKNILPRLMADAFMAEAIAYEQFLRFSGEAKTAFYQAAHCAAMSAASATQRA